MRRAAHQLAVLATIVAFLVWQAEAYEGVVRLSHDGPVILGGNITFKAELFDINGKVPSGKFIYTWKDDALVKHFYVTETTTNTTTYYTVNYPPSIYHVGEYVMEVDVCMWGWLGIRCGDFTSRRISFRVSSLLNGNLTIEQSNATLKNDFVSSSETAKLSVNLRGGDFDYIKETATSITTYWFIDCKLQNTSDFKLNYNFSHPMSFHTIEALVIASYDPPPTTVSPITTSTTPAPIPSNTTVPATDVISVNVTTSTTSTTTVPPTTVLTAVSNLSTLTPLNQTAPVLGNLSYPFVCNSMINPESNKTYGYFQRQVKIRAPISKINIEGSTWIQPWKSLSLIVTCNGTGPFHKCVEIHLGKYNVTGNETCNQNSEILDACKFSFNHYFLDALEYTVLIILSNEVSTEIRPVAINIYKLTPKPQLSVIVVPVSCSLVAVVLIIFGIAYYVQNRSRFTVEVADFDFGQSSADMEYKTFTERLRDSFNNAVRPGDEKLLGTHSTSYYGSMNH